MYIQNIEDYATTEEMPVGFEMTDRDDTPLHNHSFIEIFYVVSGEIQHVYKNGNKNKIIQSLIEGDIVILMKDDVHCFIRNSGNKCLHRDLIIREDFFKKVCDYIDEELYSKFLKKEIPNKINVSLDKIAEYEKEINIITQAMQSTTNKKMPIIKSLITSLLSQFLIQDTEQYYYNFPPWFKNLLANFNKVQFMQAGLDVILLPFNYDKKYLCHVFKKYMGMTMTEYLNKNRLQYAVSLIQNTNDSISDIAQSVGFSSVSYFNVIFKEQYGISPKVLRKKTKIKQL